MSGQERDPCFDDSGCANGHCVDFTCGRYEYDGWCTFNDLLTSNRCLGVKCSRNDKCRSGQCSGTTPLDDVCIEPLPGNETNAGNQFNEGQFCFDDSWCNGGKCVDATCGRYEYDGWCTFNDILTSNRCLGVKCSRDDKCRSGKCSGSTPLDDVCIEPPQPQSSSSGSAGSSISSSSSGDSDSTGAIIAGVVGGLILIAIIVTAIFCCCKVCGDDDRTDPEIKKM